MFHHIFNSLGCNRDEDFVGHQGIHVLIFSGVLARVAMLSLTVLPLSFSLYSFFYSYSPLSAPVFSFQL